MSPDPGSSAGDARRQPLWEPSAQMRECTEMTRFMRWASELPAVQRARSGSPFTTYGELWEWSVSEVEQFWEAIWEFCGLRATRPYSEVLDSRVMPGARWFAGAELNYAENLLMRSHDEDALALLHCSELRELDSLSWGELRARVGVLAAGLRALGVTRGDRVAAYMPNIPETLIALLASASIGAIFSSAAPEFGARSVIDRFAQIEPKVLLGVDGYRHGGKDFDRTEALGTIAAGLPSVRHTALLPYLSEALSQPASAEGLRGGMLWQELLTLGAQGAEEPLRFESLPFEHPLWVLYSSGTTGLPKAIVHSHGGILLEQLKKRLHLDLRPGDRMFWFTTTGWMMWNFLVGCLLSDAAIVLYDGSPAHPDTGALWRLAERTQMTCMGLSAGLIVACAKAQIEPGREYDLDRLRAIGSTGSPLSPEGFRWIYESVGEDKWLFSTSGGTDVCSAFVGGCPLLPVYEGELQCRILGAAVEAFDEHGEPLVDEVGELVLTEPLPSMPIFFWGEDPPRRDGSGGERYRESYFSMYPGVWRHGDWIRITPRGGAVIYGRSDATINRQGVRMGTSEIYRAAASLPEVLDTLVVDIPRGDESAGAELWMALFVVLSDGATLDDELRGRIARRIREDCSPRHVPNDILQIEEVPRTLSGKVLEVPVKKILMGTPAAQAASVDSLANPQALEYFVRLRERLAAAAGQLTAPVSAPRSPS